MIHSLQTNLFMSTHICPNCSNEFTGHFCNHCGQKEAHKITMHYIWHDLAHAFTHTDRGFFHMMGRLFVKPGKVAYEYIVEAKRKRYFPPFQYLIFIAAITTFIVVSSHFVEHSQKSIEELMGINGKYSAKQAALMLRIQLYVSKYYNFLLLLQLPFYSLAAWIIYRKYKLNYAEMLTLQTFVSAQHALIGLVLMFLVLISGSSFAHLNLIIQSISLLYYAWTYMQFFKERGVANVFKAILSYILGLTFFIMFAMLLIILAGIVLTIME